MNETRNANVRIPTKTNYSNYGIGQIATHDDLNMDFDSAEEAIAVLASKNLSDDELQYFDIVMQIRN